MEEFDPFEQDQMATHALIGTRLTLQEIQIAISFLKRRFPRYPIEQIVSTLDHYNCQKKLGHIPRIPPTPHNHLDNRPKNLQNNQSNKCSTNERRQSIKQPAEEKKIREQENIKLVSNLFCEHGDDYSLVKRYIPQLTPASYRNILLTIANTTLKELVNFIKKECNIKINDLTEPQKITIKTAILNAHQWMGTKSIGAIQTLFKFISKKFINKHKLITKNQAIQLYSAIAHRVNDKSLDLISLQPESEFGEQINQKFKFNPTNKAPSIDSEQDMLELIAQTFLEYFNTQKISNVLMKKYGLDKRWQKQNIESSLRQIIQRGLQKLQKKGKRSLFYISDKLLTKITQPPHINFQYSIVQLYLSKQRNKIFQQKLLDQLAPFLRQQNYSQNNHQSQSEESSQFQQPQSFHEQLISKMSSFTDIFADKHNNPNSIFQEMFGVEDLSSQKGKYRKPTKEKPSKPQSLSEQLLYFSD